MKVVCEDCGKSIEVETDECLMCEECREKLRGGKRIGL